MNKKLTTENPANFYFRNLRPSSKTTEAIRKVLYNRQTKEDGVLIFHTLLEEFGRTDKNRVPLEPIVKDCGFAIQKADLHANVIGVLCTGERISRIFRHEEKESDKLIVLNMTSNALLNDTQKRVAIVQLFAHYLLTATADNCQDFGCAFMKDETLCDIPEYLYVEEIIEDVIDEDKDQSAVSNEQDYTPLDYDSEDKDEEIEENEIIFSPEPE